MRHSPSRRRFLESSLFVGATSVIGSRLALASADTDARFVFVLLRGALDGLSAVPPIGDPAYAGLRGQIALTRSGDEAALPLDSTFGLHPALKFFHASYAAKELAVLHAVASPYRERSHFDGQDVLENGGVRLRCTPEIESAILRPIYEAMEQVYVGDARGNPFALLAEIDCPVRVTTAGKSGPIYKEMASRAVSLIPRVSTLVFEGAGHCVAQELPARVVEAVREFSM